MAGSGDGRLLLVSGADVMEHVPSFNLRFYFALAQVSPRWPLSLSVSMVPVKTRMNQQGLALQTRWTQTGLRVLSLKPLLPLCLCSDLLSVKITLSRILTMSFHPSPPLTLFVASSSRTNTLATVSRQLLTLLGQCTTAPSFSRRQLAY